MSRTARVAAVIGSLALATTALAACSSSSSDASAEASASMVGGMAGRSIYDNAQRDRRVQRGQVRVCDPVPAGNGRYGDDYYGDGRVSGYDVTYEYGNRTYHTRTDHHPGDRIRIRVDVRPE